MVLGTIIFVIIDAHHNGDILAFGGGGNQDFLGAGIDMAFCLFRGGEQAGGFNHQLYAQLGPRQFSRGLGADDKNIFAVDHQHIVGLFVRRGLLGADGTIELTLDGIILHQVSQVVGRNNITHRYHVKLGAQQSLLDQSTENKPTDTAKTVNRNLCRHKMSPLI